MPSKTAQQQRFMRLAASEDGRKMLAASGKKLPPIEVAQEFVRADTRKKRGPRDRRRQP